MLLQLATTLLMVGLAAAQTSTLNIQAPGAEPGLSWAGSVIQACADRTTLALQCTAESSDSIYANELCSSSGAPVVTLTVGPSFFGISSSTAVQGVTLSIQESCQVTGTTAAVCAVSASGANAGTTTAIVTTTTYGTANMETWHAELTAGVEKLNSTNACGTSGGSSDGKSGGERLAAGLGALGAASLFAIMVL